MLNMISIRHFALVIAVVFFGIAITVQGQTTSIFTTGLTRPVKMISAGQNSLLVSEAGTTESNNGRVSLVNRSTGSRQTFISGLPSGVNNLAGPPGPSGPTGLLLSGRTLYLVISGGDTVQNVGGFEVPNPNPPASPIFGSVLSIDLPVDWEQGTSPFVMTLSDHQALLGGNTITLTNANGQSVAARLVVDLPNYTPNPQPNAPNAVRFANLFGLEILGRDLYVLDASQNDIKKVNIDTGQTSVLVIFANRPNPLFGTMGGPFIEPVPDSIHRVGQKFLVTLLTGFPFVRDLSEVRTVDIATGANVVFIPGLTSAIDVLQVAASLTAPPSYYTLEYSTNQLAGAPGRLRFYSSPTAIPRNVVSLTAPSSMVRNDANGDIYVTNIFPGTITKVSFPSTLFDFDADGKADQSVFRPATGAWYVNRSRDGLFGIEFGSATDKIVPADYDGDGKTDVAIYRPSDGRWYILNSGDGTYSVERFGTSEDIPSPADYDGDSRSDVAVFRPSSGVWYIRNSSNGSYTASRFGQNGDVPTIGDFDGDDKSDVAVYRPSSSVWYRLNSSTGISSGEQFGITTDKVVPADYNGDGKTDIAVYRPTEGRWYIKTSPAAPNTTFLFGISSDVPAPADYDGDGKADIAVFRPSDGTWYAANSANGSFTISQFGQSGDLPIPHSFGN